jgi:hypothetical protein
MLNPPPATAAIAIQPLWRKNVRCSIGEEVGALAVVVEEEVGLAGFIVSIQ